MRCWFYWLASCAAVAAGTHCYNCGSLGPQIASCFQLYIKPSQVVLDCQDGGVALVMPGCVKVTYADGDNDSVWRGCADFSSLTASGGENSCAEGVYNGKPVRYCHCSTDLCNGGRPLGGADGHTHLLTLVVTSMLPALLACSH